MQELRIAPGKNSPEIIFSPDGRLKISGRSIHENVAEFFAPVDNWISKYIEDPAPFTSVDMNLEYFNSASAKVFISLLEKIKHVNLKNGKFVFNWYYEDGDEDIYERGEYFAVVLDVPINFIKTGSSS